MFMSFFFLLILIGFPLSAFAQFIDKGDRVEVTKGTKLCTNVKLEQTKGSRTRSCILEGEEQMRSNGTQSVGVFVQEDVYDTKSGDTSVKETVYQED
jgi:hypothetical protein